VLKEHGMTLDAISASNMRHVLNGLKEEFGAMQAVCDAAEAVTKGSQQMVGTNYVLINVGKMVNLKAALEAYLKLKT